MKNKNRCCVAATLLAMILFVSAGSAGAQKASPEKAPLDKAATVNGSVIPKQTLEREVRLFTDRMVRQGQQVPDVQVPVLRNEILDSLIDQELLYQDSQKEHMQVEKKAVEWLAENGKTKAKKVTFKDYMNPPES